MIIEWICQNKEWIFSGIGVTILGIGIAIFKKIFVKRAKNSSKTVINQVNEGTNNTIIGIQNNYGTKEENDG